MPSDKFTELVKTPATTLFPATDTLVRLIHPSGPGLAGPCPAPFPAMAPEPSPESARTAILRNTLTFSTAVVTVALALAGWRMVMYQQPVMAALCGLGLLGSLTVARLFNQTLSLHQRRFAQLHQALQAEQKARQSLEAAFEVIPDAAALYDADDRLVLCSDRYRKMNPVTAHLMRPGTSFEQIVRAGAASGEVVAAFGREEDWIAQRLEEHRHPRQDSLQSLSDNRWVRISERRTPDGGLIGLRTDVTEFVRQQQALEAAQQDAQQARRLLVRALDALPTALEIFDDNDCLVVYNRALQRMFPHIDYPVSLGRKFADMAEESLRSGIVIDARGQEERWLSQRLQERAEKGNRTFLQQLEGPQWVQVYERRTPENYIVAIRLDVTDMVQQRQALQTAQHEAQQARQLLQDAIEALPEGLAVFDADDRLLLCNTQYRVMYPKLASLLQPGRSFDELLAFEAAHGHYAQALGQEDDWETVRRRCHLQPGPPMVVNMHDGRWLRVHERRTAENMIVGVHVDVTELIQKEQQLATANELLATLSATDGLTGLHNRRSFDEAIAREWQRCARHGLPLALLLVDIDHFKLYNDHYGHLAGDDCLRRVARLLAADVRRAGDLVARYGGEEFVLLLPGTDDLGARETAQRCLERLRTENIPHAASPTSQRLSMSIGIAAWIPQAQNQPHSLINAADNALYQAKQTGRAQYVVASSQPELL